MPSPVACRAGIVGVVNNVIFSFSVLYAFLSLFPYWRRNWQEYYKNKTFSCFVTSDLSFVLLYVHFFCYFAVPFSAFQSLIAAWRSNHSAQHSSCSVAKVANNRETITCKSSQKTCKSSQISSFPFHFSWCYIKCYTL